MAVEILMLKVVLEITIHIMECRRGRTMMAKIVSWKSGAQTKIVCYQALGYLIAVLPYQLFPLIELLNVYKTDSVQMLRIVLRSLQGLFNLLIFMGRKIHNKLILSLGVRRFRKLSHCQEKNRPCLLVIL